MSSAHTVRQSLDNADIDPDLTWTTDNVAEAFPGVFTTLGFTFIDAPMELAFRKIFVRLDVFPPTQGYLPDRAEDMFWTVFDGRAAANIDKFREIACLTPGTSATAVEQQLFGRGSTGNRRCQLDSQISGDFCEGSQAPRRTATSP